MPGESKGTRKERCITRAEKPTKAIAAKDAEKNLRARQRPKLTDITKNKQSRSNRPRCRCTPLGKKKESDLEYQMLPWGDDGLVGRRTV